MSQYPIAARNGLFRFKQKEKLKNQSPTATTAIGIDVGIARFATMSDGSYIAPLNSFKKHQATFSEVSTANEPQSQI